MSKKYLYKFLLDGLVSNYDKSKWVVGKWRTDVVPTRECQGLNASEYIPDALGYVQGTILAQVECGGKIIKGDDKWTCEKMRIVKVAEWGKAESVRLSVFSARLCSANFEKLYPEDVRPRKAIEAAEAWLTNPAWSAKSAASAARSAARKKIHGYTLSLITWRKA